VLQSAPAEVDVDRAAGGLHYHTLYRDKALDYGTGLG